MRLAEAKDIVLSLILAGQPEAARSLMVGAASPDGDPGKFLIDGKAARAIHRFDGWHVPISLGWFSGGYDPPVIQKTAFYWYAFAIPKTGRYRADHYFICDYLQMREWVLAFTAPLGDTHRHRASWRSDLRLYPGEQAGYFRWGDEPSGLSEQPGRVFEVDNLASIAIPRPGNEVKPAMDGRQRSCHRECFVPFVRQDLKNGTIGECHRQAAVLADLCRGDGRLVQPEQRSQARSVRRLESPHSACQAVRKWRLDPDLNP